MYLLIILISTTYMGDVKFQEFTSLKNCQAAQQRISSEFKNSWCEKK